MYHRQQNKCYPPPQKKKKSVYLPISKVHTILAVANLLAHNNKSQICYCGKYRDLLVILLLEAEAYVVLRLYVQQIVEQDYRDRRTFLVSIYYLYWNVKITDLRTRINSWLQILFE